MARKRRRGSNIKEKANLLHCTAHNVVARRDQRFLSGRPCHHSHPSFPLPLTALLEVGSLAARGHRAVRRHGGKMKSGGGRDGGRANTLLRL
jgi:hypothetical protein